MRSSNLIGNRDRKQAEDLANLLSENRTARGETAKTSATLEQWCRSQTEAMGELRCQLDNLGVYLGDVLLAHMSLSAASQKAVVSRLDFLDDAVLATLGEVVELRARQRTPSFGADTSEASPLVATAPMNDDEQDALSLPPRDRPSMLLLSAVLCTRDR